MNFSLHSTTGPSLATLPPGAQDLPRLQRPARRRLSPGKVMAGGLVALLGVGGVVVYSVPGHEQADQGPVRRRQRPTSSPTVVRPGALPITVVEKGSPGKLQEQRRLLPGRGADDDHHDHARGNAGQEGRDRLRARLGGAQGSARQSEDHDQERRGELRERQADPRGGRDRRRRVRRRHLQAGPRHGRG